MFARRRPTATPTIGGRAGAFSLSAYFHKNVTKFPRESVAKKPLVCYNTHIYLHLKERECV